MRGRYKPWALPYLKEHVEVVSFSLDIPLLNELVLEIGSGKGDFAISYAKDHPSREIICLERDISIAGIFAKKVVEEGINNIKIVPSDFDLIYETLKRYKFEAIYLNFSDPWPKKKHEKRRLTFAPRIKLIASLLKKGGKIYIKTDNDLLYLWSKEQINLTDLKIVEDEENYSSLVKDDYMTEYEKRFRNEGKSIHRLVLKGE